MVVWQTSLTNNLLCIFDTEHTVTLGSHTLWLSFMTFPSCLILSLSLSHKHTHTCTHTRAHTTPHTHPHTHTHTHPHTHTFTPTTHTPINTHREAHRVFMTMPRHLTLHKHTHPGFDGQPVLAGPLGWVLSLEEGSGLWCSASQCTS